MFKLKPSSMSDSEYAKELQIYGSEETRAEAKISVLKNFWLGSNK